jgi:hypothetical protein
MSLANAVGFRLKALEIADEHLAQVEEFKGVRGGYVGLYGVLRQAVSLNYENVTAELGTLYKLVLIILYNLYSN